MAKEYMSVRAVAAEAGVSVQAVYKWIHKGELKAEVVRISDYEKRYHVSRASVERFLRSQEEKPEVTKPAAKKPLTVKALRESGLIGMWKDRDDIGDTLEFARQLRKRASTRHRD